MIMLKEARLIDPATRVDAVADILISERKIFKIGEDLRWEASLMARAKGERLEIIECAGLVAAPGLVDIHVHLRDPGFTYKENIESAARAAAAGGFTSIVAMANTNPPIDSEEGILYVLQEGRRTGIRVYTCATITKGMEGTELVDMKSLRESGALGFTDDGKPLLDRELVREAMRRARSVKLPLSFHEEDPTYIRESGVNAGPAAEALSLTGADRQSEILLIERDCRLAKETGASICIQHISTKEGVEAVRRAKRSGVRVYAEATPHHFSLTEEAVALYGTNAKMNPPLRTEEDRLAIIEGLRDGTIDFIATDHAPHSPGEKEKPFMEAPSGIIGLETSLSLGIMELVEKGYLSMSKLIAKMSYEPARFYNLEAGILKEDAAADLTLFDPALRWNYDKTESRSKNSPWLGKELKGKVIMTFCQGLPVYDGRGRLSKTERSDGA